MPHSCIGKVFAVVLATPQTAQKIAYMRGSDRDAVSYTHLTLPTKRIV